MFVVGSRVGRQLAAVTQSFPLTMHVSSFRWSAMSLICLMEAFGDADGTPLGEKLDLVLVHMREVGVRARRMAESGE